MKKLLLIIPFVVRCQAHSPKPLTPIDTLYPIVDKIDAVDGTGFRTIRLYIIDSCEYIGYINVFKEDFLTHKGNCKFCIERRKNETVRTTRRK